MSETARESQGDHHAVAAGTVSGQGMVFVPVSGRADTSECDEIALNGTTRAQRWSYPIPPANCTIYSVANPTITDYDSDGRKEVLAATTERAVIGFDALRGDVEFWQNLTSYGYIQPIVANFIGGGTNEIFVVDVRGGLCLPSKWVGRLGETTLVVHVGKTDRRRCRWDGSNELVVGLGGEGGLDAFEGNGSTRWRRTDLLDSSITWMTTGRADDGPGFDVVVATTDGTVPVVDGQSGRVRWRRDFGAFAAVHAFSDGDGDGEPEIYAVARDGKLRSLDARSGTIEWTTTLTTEDVQMMPPPSIGDVDGNGDPELVAVTNDGIVSLVDPQSGEIADSYERDIHIFVHPTLADIDGGGGDEIFVTYGDGRVVALSGIYHSENIPPHSSSLSKHCLIGNTKTKTSRAKTAPVTL